MNAISHYHAPARSIAFPRARLRMVFGRTLIYVTLVAIAVVQAFPLVWMILTSVKNQREVFGSFLPARLDFGNFVRVWNAIDLPRHLVNSLYVTTLTVVIVVFVATLAGYVFARFHFRGRDLLFYMFIGAMMIPGQAILIPMFQFLKGIGLLNTLTGLSLSYLGGSVAFAIFLMRSFFLSLPQELGDAGRIDGCTEFGVFRYVYLPLAKSGIATVVIIQSMGTWNEFMFSNTFISSPDSKTIQAALFQAVGRYSTDYTALSSGLMLALVPIVTVYLILQKQFVQGLTAGALKG
ncbi:carbohydrate ABC transporter permease [Inquilinus sp. NPDC058860]|uniref:carbohydrate ABC transporter permease n=1 Tax=Inquilinus sp. NPDC058860 TaxID=3346652 RepID=UPI0036B17089